MPRTAREILIGHPHHITQRGNRSLPVFFQDEDYKFYKVCLYEQMKLCGVKIWSYCLMTNHVHLIAVPEQTDSFSRLFREAHRRYTGYINKREGWSGHLWQDRYHSEAMNETHGIMAARYIEMNPVEAGLVARPEDYPWSSAASYRNDKFDPLLDKETFNAVIRNWNDFLKTGPA